MKSSFRRLGVGTAILAAVMLSIFTSVPVLRAQSADDAHSSMHAMQNHDQHGDIGMMAHHNANAETDVEPTLPGQDAFGAIQEIVRILEADPKTDWSTVDLEALRQHLIDMNEVTLKADIATKPVNGGIQVAAAGSNRTLDAIRRMVPAHAQEIEQTHLNGWSAKTEPLSNGILLTVTSADPKEVQQIRGLGFIGVMVSGHHHQPHHLAMARGEIVH